VTVTIDQLQAARRQAWRYGRQARAWYDSIVGKETLEGVFVNKTVVDAAGAFFAVLAGFLDYDSYEMQQVRDAYTAGVDDEPLFHAEDRRPQAFGGVR
jgi:hypothetical protein